MIKDDLRIYDDLSSLSEGFTSFLTNEVMNGSQPINIALSGGSTPKVIFNYWSSQCKDSINWENICFFWGDERCVPPNDEMSNYGMTKEYLLDKINISPNNIFRIHGENEAHEEALWYSDVLDDYLPVVNEIPAFNLVMLGLGDDGHTLSIFPDQIELWNISQNCAVSKHPETGMERVTINGKIVNNSFKVAFLVTGESKAEKIRDIIHNREKYQNLYPAALVNPDSGHIHWFLDKAAASLL